MNLDTIFNPNSIAIIGVSHETHKVGYLVASNMLEQGFSGDLYFVNPKGGSILGKEVYSSIEALPSAVDLAVLAVPAKIALPAFDELHAKGIQNVVLFAAGFKEVGESGMENERMLLEKAKEYNLTILGPNCIGYVNTEKGINATFLKTIAPKGNVGFISQSGALGSVMVDDFVGRSNVGFSYFISMGNKSIIDEADALEFLANDPRTAVIAMYLEDVKDGEKFKRVLKDATLRKPVVILKSGTTEEGSKAALSHTGGLAGNDAVFSSVFAQNGAIRARDYTEFTTLLRLFSFDRVPTSPRVLVLSNAGGVGVLLADQLVEQNLSLVTISEQNKQELTKVFGESKKISVRNPIDILGDASAFDYEKAITATIDEKDVGSIVVLLTPQANTEIMETAHVMVRAQHAFEKPIYPVFMGKDSVHEAHDFFEEQRIASFRHHDYLTRAIAKAVWYKQYLSETAGHLNQTQEPVLESPQLDRVRHIVAQAAGRPFLNLSESLEVLSLIQVPVVPMQHVASPEEAVSVATAMGFPVTLKLSSDTITHKTEVKGVYPGLRTAEEVSAAYTQLAAVPSANGAFVQKQSSGHEIFIGAKRDPNFGIVMLVGLGGIYAELFKDVANRIVPFSQKEFISMLKETHLHSLLSGFRGAKPVDLGLLYSVVHKVGVLMEAVPEIKEIDMNPLFVDVSEVTAVDARIII